MVSASLTIFFFKGKTVTKLKTLKSDPYSKINKKAQNLIEDASFPLIFGSFDLTKAISKMADGERINREIYLLATRQLEDILRSANKQIISTKRFLGLPESTTGMLLVANDTVKTIPAHEISNRFCELLSQK